MKAQILLIDDDPVVNFIHSRVIQKKFPGIALLVFENGRKGLTHILSNPDYAYLIFLDLNMPVMNGWEFLEAISLEASEVDLQVHIVTSSVNPEDRQAAKKFNMVYSFLIKPLKSDDISPIDFGNNY